MEHPLPFMREHIAICPAVKVLEGLGNDIKYGTAIDGRTLQPDCIVRLSEAIPRLIAVDYPQVAVERKNHCGLILKNVEGFRHGFHIVPNADMRMPRNSRLSGNRRMAAHNEGETGERTLPVTGLVRMIPVMDIERTLAIARVLQTAGFRRGQPCTPTRADRLGMAARTKRSRLASWSKPHAQPQ